MKGNFLALAGFLVVNIGGNGNTPAVPEPEGKVTLTATKVEEHKQEGAEKADQKKVNQ